MPEAKVKEVLELRKKYISPEFENIKLNILTSVLNISQGENGASGGFIEDPGEEEEGS